MIFQQNPIRGKFKYSHEDSTILVPEGVFQ